MNKLARIWWVLGVAVAALGTAGCGGGGGAEPAAKVDVTAQVQKLKGSGDEKAAALTELAAAGPGAAAAVENLIPLLKDEDHVVRQLTAYALGKIGPAAKNALPALKAAMNDNQISVITAINNSITAIDPANAPKETVPNVSGQ